MGLLDTLFGKAGATPVFNPNDPMQGFYDPTEEERRQARKMAALQAGAGMLMNNTGNYGAFAPALGAGIAQGVQGYQQGLQIGPERRMKEMQQRLYGQQIQAQMQRASGDKDDDEIASGIFKTVFQDAGYDPETGGFLPVAARDGSPLLRLTFYMCIKNLHTAAHCRFKRVGNIVVVTGVRIIFSQMPCQA